MATANVNSLTNQTLYIHDFCVQFGVDIFAVIETWLHNYIADSATQINNYNVFRNDFVSLKPKHGVCIYVKKSMTAIVCTHTPYTPHTFTIF